jgi:hypothetical protein
MLAVIMLSCAVMQCSCVVFIMLSVAFQEAFMLRHL